MNAPGRIPLALRVAAKLLPPDAREEVLGDLVETCREREQSRGRWSAFFWTLRQPFASMRARLAFRDASVRGLQPMWFGTGADLRTGIRNLLRRPGIAVGTTLTIALGIGATTTIYSVVDGVVLRPLPYDDPSTLVTIGVLAPGASADPETGLQDLASTMSSLEIEALRERARWFEAVGALGTFRMLESDENGVEEYVPAARVSAEVFSMLGVAPTLGRAFAPDEYVLTGVSPSPVVMISYGFWQRRYGGDASIVGRTLEFPGSPLDGARPTIVGVLPEDFQPPETFFPQGELPEVWAPMTLPGNADQAPARRLVILGLAGLGRLAAGITVEQARAEAAAISRDLATSSPQAMRMPGGGGTSAASHRPQRRDAAPLAGARQAPGARSACGARRFARRSGPVGSPRSPTTCALGRSR